MEGSTTDGIYKGNMTRADPNKPYRDGRYGRFQGGRQRALVGGGCRFAEGTLLMAAQGLCRCADLRCKDTTVNL
eukprot:589930-Pelagomonas_calceolata.AAC.1